jgi:hypothetical protein
MAASTTLYLKNFKPNDFMAWHVVTQAGNTATIVLKDNNKVYCTAKKTNRSGDIQMIEEGSAFYGGAGDLRVEITVNEGAQKDLDVSPSSNAILDKQSNTVGFVYTYCVEDWLDKDYNDFYIHIVGWNKKG